MAQNKHDRTARKRQLLADDMKVLSDELRSRKPTIEAALGRIVEALIALLESK